MDLILMIVSIILSASLLLVFSIGYHYIWLTIFQDISQVKFSKLTRFEMIAVYTIVIYMFLDSAEPKLLGICLYPIISFAFQFKKEYRNINNLSAKIFDSFYSYNLGFLIFWLYGWIVKAMLVNQLSHFAKPVAVGILMLIAGILTIFTHKWVIFMNPAKSYLNYPLIKNNIKEVNIILLIIYFVTLVSYLNEVTSLNSEGISEYAKYTMFIFIPILLIIFFYLTFKSQLAAKEEINQLQKTQLDNLAVYTEEIEKMYQTLRGFRHDYQNILLSLQESIDTKDIEQIEQVYQEILASENVRLVRQIEATNINELANIRNSAIKSVMFWKITQARDRKIAVEVEIKEEIPDLPMASLHFIRIFSILIDNAMEEAKLTVNPRISIAFFVNQGDIIFAISNSTLLTSMNISQLKKPGYTTKGRNRGVGLSNVDEILKQYDFCYLETELADGVFLQTLTMEE